MGSDADGFRIRVSAPPTSHLSLGAMTATRDPSRRRCLGHQVRTQNDANMDGTGSVFAAGKRELVAVPRCSPAVHYHSLLAETGGTIDRYREFIVFHGEYLYPEYVIAYQRCAGSRAAV